MKQKSAWIVAAVALAAVVWTLTPGGDAAATTAMAKEEGLVCTACHDKPGSKLLTDRGKYYEHTGTVEGFTAIEGSFGRCTYCHVQEPGSQELTAKGKALCDLLCEDMDGLRQWVVESHPEEIAKAIADADAAAAEEKPTP